MLVKLISYSEGRSQRDGPEACGEWGLEREEPAEPDGGEESINQGVDEFVLMIEFDDIGDHNRLVGDAGNSEAD